MKEYTLKKAFISFNGETIILKGGILNQKEILDVFGLTEDDKEFNDWFEEIEQKEFTRSDMKDFALYYFGLDYGSQNDPDLLENFLNKRRNKK